MLRMELIAGKKIINSLNINYKDKILMNKFKLEPLKLLVIGKTGVGKSAFCNFLFGEEVFESAVGEPVTEGIQSHQFKLEDIDVSVYDTEGIEVSNAKEWKNRLDDLIGYSYKKTEKVHGIFYLINSSSARVEDFEIDLINELSDRNMPIFVILTHEDVAKPEQLTGIKKQLESIKGINIISTCTIQKKLRGGRLSVSDKDLEASHTNLVTLFLETSGKYYLYDNLFLMLDTFEVTMSDLRRKVLREISEANLSIFNITEWEEKLEGIGENLESFLEGFEPELESMSDKLEGVSYALSPYIKSNPFEDFFEKLDDNFNIDFEIDQIKSLKSIQEDADILEDGEGFFLKLGAGLSLGYKAVTAESTLKEIAKDGINLISRFLNKQVYEVEDSFIRESWVYKKN